MTLSFTFWFWSLKVSLPSVPLTQPVAYWTWLRSILAASPSSSSWDKPWVLLAIVSSTPSMMFCCDRPSSLSPILLAKAAWISSSDLAWASASSLSPYNLDSLAKRSATLRPLTLSMPWLIWFSMSANLSWIFVICVAMLWIEDSRSLFCWSGLLFWFGLLLLAEPCVPLPELVAPSVGLMRSELKFGACPSLSCW